MVHSRCSRQSINVSDSPGGKLLQLEPPEGGAVIQGWADASVFPPPQHVFRTEIRLQRVLRQLAGEVLRGQATAWECEYVLFAYWGPGCGNSRPTYLPLPDGILGHVSPPPCLLPL